MKYIVINYYLMVTWYESMIRVYSLSMLVMITSICGFMLMILICAAYQQLIDELFEQIRTSFEITTKDMVDSYIGIKHERLANGDLKLTQPKLLNKLYNS